MSACFFLVVTVLGTIHQDRPNSTQQPHCSCFLPTPCSFQDAVTSTCLNSLHTWLAHSLTTLCHLLPLLPLHPLPSFISSRLVAKSPSSLVSLPWLPLQRVLFAPPGSLFSIFVSAPGSLCGSPCPSYSSWVSPPSGWQIITMRIAFSIEVSLESLLASLFPPPLSSLFLLSNPPQTQTSGLAFYLFIYLAAQGFNCSMWDLVPWPVIKPGPYALGVWSLNHWSAREVPWLKLWKSSLSPNWRSLWTI